VTRSFELPDIDSVIDIIGSSNEIYDWESLLADNANSMLFGNQESNALFVYLSVLSDAIESGWQLTTDKQNTTVISAPSFDDRDGMKRHIQTILDLRVSEQKKVPTIQTFLQHKAGEVRTFITQPESIPDSPEELGNWFDDIYLSVVESEENKSIYRYLRHSWRIPYSTTPGRTMSFLVRKSNGHVIGIFTLASPTLWMSGRDEALGFEDFSLSKGETKSDWINRWSKIGLVDDAKKPHPHSGQFTISEFINSIRNALIRRLEQLPLAVMDGIDKKELAQLGVNIRSTKPIQDLSISGRNVAKRVRLFSKCRDALLVLSKTEPISSIEDLWSSLHGDNGSKELLSALKQGLREQKTHAFAGCIADISICGAIPPYNPLRVGKLVAMLTMSDFVSQAWEAKYRDDVSVISTEVAGRPIIRDSQFAAMSTTGLYGRGNIQYDRVKIGSGIATRRMQNIGETGEGVGDKRRGPSTLTLSRRTWGLIDGYTTTYEIGEGTSGRFGEGTSARLRLLQATRKSILEQLPNIADGQLWDQIVLNPFSRSVHVCLLSRKSVRYMLGIDTKLQHVAPLPSVEEIVEHWKNRWLMPALTRENSDIIDRVRSQDISQSLPEFGGWNS
tara:strand:+ start:172 stop:2019 length:1848 start_codon:yes stop_codon:yes gene_type:complete